MRHGRDSELFFGVFAPVLSLDELSSRLDPETGAFDIEDDAPRVDEILELAEARAAVRGFVAGLARRDQEIIRRLFWKHETQSQIADSFGVSKMAISKSMARICGRGRQMLAPL